MEDGGEPSSRDPTVGRQDSARVRFSRKCHFDAWRPPRDSSIGFSSFKSYKKARITPTALTSAHSSASFNSRLLLLKPFLDHERFAFPA